MQLWASIAVIYLEFGRVCILDDSSEAVQHPRGDAALHLQPVLDSLAFHTVTCPKHLHCMQPPRYGMLSVWLCSCLHRKAAR